MTGLLTMLEHQSYDGVTAAQALKIKKQNGFWSTNISTSITSIVAGFEGVGQAIKGPYNQFFFHSNTSYSFGYVRLRVKFDDAAATYKIAAIWSGATQAHYEIQRTTSRKLRVVSYNLINHTSTAADLSDGAWYDLEMCWKNHTSGAGTFDVKVNAVADASLAITGVSSQGATWNRIYVGEFAGTARNLTVDDVIIKGGDAGYNADDFMCDTLGNPRTWPDVAVNDGYLKERWKRSDNDLTTPLFDLADEVPGDSDTSYLYVTSLDNAQSRRVFLKLSNVSASVVTVYCLSSYVLASSSQVSDDVFYQSLRIASNTYAFPGVLPDQGFTSYTTNGGIWETDPSTLDDWIPDTVSGMELGVEVLGNTFSGGSKSKISSVYVEVLYSGALPPPDPPLSSGASLLVHTSHRLAKLFKVERKDGEILYFTDHDTPLEYRGFTYDPSGGMSGTAVEVESGMKEGTQDVRGAVTNDRITHADLHQGRYREAKVTETVVDWLYPFAGPITQRLYWIVSTRFDGVMWQAELSTFPTWMRQKAGGIYNRTCRYDLFGPGCTLNAFVDLDFYDLGQAVVSVASNGSFTTSSGYTSAQQADGWFNYGKIKWKTGANALLNSEIRKWVGSPTYQVDLFEPCRGNIEVGDTFEIYVGCDKTFGTCIIKFGNGVNFGGYPDLPGTDKLLRPAGTS